LTAPAVDGPDAGSSMSLEGQDFVVMETATHWTTDVSDQLDVQRENKVVG
jgi:hypothetical protein